MNYSISKERLLEIKEEFKEILYYFGCHSEFDEKKQRFNEVYELDGIKWDIGKITDDGYGLDIPYEGEIPFLLFDNLSYNELRIVDRNGGKSVSTDFFSFIKAITMIHNFYYGTQIKSDEVYDFFKARELRKNSLDAEMSINDLARVANEYYINHFDSKMDDYDLAINQVIEEIEERHHNFHSADDTCMQEKSSTFETIYNKQARTRYNQFKKTHTSTEGSIMTRYEMNQEDIIDETNELCRLFSIKPLSKDGNDYCLMMTHECYAAKGDVYSKKMYQYNQANDIGFIIGAKFHEDGGAYMDGDLAAFVDYNLNSHTIRIADYTNGNPKETKRTISLEEKEALYNLFKAIQEKLKLDFKAESYQKNYKIKKNRKDLIH